jgi:MFS family permease
MASPSAVPWYRALDRRQWYTLVAANLGWVFDGYETYALILTVAPVFRQLLPAGQLATIPFYAGLTIGVTLLGWGIGGIVGGILSDYIGRKRMLIYAILAYSLTTGLTALAWSWTSFIALRFIVGLAIGSEWGTGAAMVAEMWPPQHRGKGAGLMQCGLGIGFFLASVAWLFVSPLGPSAWRWMYVIGVLPAAATLWVRRGIDEPEAWAASNRRRREAVAQQKLGQDLDDATRRLTRFTLADLLSDRHARRLLVPALLMSTTTTLAWWGISTWVPPFVASLASANGLPTERWASLAGMSYNVGAVCGYVGFGFCADAWGRRPATLVWFMLAWALTPVLFLWTSRPALLLVACAVNGCFSLGQYTWCPVWLPEAFPTRIRATAVSFCFNAPRLIAFVGPLVAGTLITAFGNYGRAAIIVSTIYLVGIVAAPFFPETRGRPLPD